ncbi:hypothetical protein BRADI_2g02834v3 [Brachypodium distachyon]|uniref:Uncharacterized protein n=1 Tax=Brachypodium distachyon TaxID=15368 RepID=A0A0Q3FTB0_BRADI|nr:hypothetical protein BRADI_2g02834v3 [Brachypodium distachyon]
MCLRAWFSVSTVTQSSHSLGCASGSTPITFRVTNVLKLSLAKLCFLKPVGVGENKRILKKIFKKCTYPCRDVRDENMNEFAGPHSGDVHRMKL